MSNRDCTVHNESPERDAGEIRIKVRIDQQIFRRFALFDNFRLKKRWRQPVLFALIMLAFALICFSRYQKADQAVFMGSVLLAVGLGLPTIYIANFLVSLNTQSQQMGLASPRYVYTVIFADCENGIRVTTKANETAEYRWSDLHGVYHDGGCLYLYVHGTRAYLLPDGDIGEQYEALIALFHNWNVQVIRPNGSREKG